MLRLAQVPNIIGIKDATANIERGSDLLKRVPKDFAIYSGDDATCLALILLGGHGVISVTANVAPRLMHEMCAAALAGDVAARARAQLPAARAAPQALRRGQSDPGQVGGGGAGPDRARHPAAAHAALGASITKPYARRMREAGVLPAGGLRLVEGAAA